MSDSQPAPAQPAGLRVLAVDDEPPALSELAFLLDGDSRVGQVQTAPDAATALRILQEEQVDAVFLDVRMPGLTGLDLARVLSRFREAPPVVFVTAHDEHAVEAFELSAVDYLLKPVRQARLSEALRRVMTARDAEKLPTKELAPAAAPAVEAAARPAATEPDEDEVIPVELAGVVRFVSRSEVRYVAARGDYARLFTAEGSHLVRVALTSLADRWQNAGFVRVHRSHLVSLRHIVEIRSEHGRLSVQVTGGAIIPVSRRHARQLRDLLLRRTPAGKDESGGPAEAVGADGPRRSSRPGHANGQRAAAEGPAAPGGPVAPDGPVGNDDPAARDSARDGSAKGPGTAKGPGPARRDGPAGPDGRTAHDAGHHGRAEGPPPPGAKSEGPSASRGRAAPRSTPRPGGSR